jgi:hypothetical protein
MPVTYHTLDSYETKGDQQATLLIYDGVGVLVRSVLKSTSRASLFYCTPWVQWFYFSLDDNHEYKLREPSWFTRTQVGCWRREGQAKNGIFARLF